jgi:hypothetical protein
MNRRRVLIGLANGLAALAASDASANCNRRRLSGTFIQPTNDQAAWSSSDWRRLFDEFEALAITNVFLQWTVLDRTAFFPTSRYRPSRAALLPVVLNLAARVGMHVWIGLHLDTRYWEEIKQDPDRIGSYFRERLRDLTLLLADLDRSVAEPPFAGWYVTDEIDDQTWQDGAKRDVLRQYLSDSVAQLRSYRPGSKVAISGFTNSTSDPDAVAAFWADILKSSAIDLLLFQDGVGEKKLRLADVPKYYAALLYTVRGVGADVGGIVELFSLKSDGKRLPGPLYRIRSQLAIADQLSSFPPVAFAVPNYMSELAGTRAGALFSEFISSQGICPQ